MNNVNEYVDEIGRLFDDDMHGFRSEVYRVVSSIRAEALRDATDRAVKWLAKETAHSGLDDNPAIMQLRKKQHDKLRAAILAGEVKE
jgi:hypothetical protein